MAKTIAIIEKGEFNAEMTKGFLESSGISASVAPCTDSYISPNGAVSAASGSNFAIFVEEKDLAEATDLLKERDKLV